MLRCARQFAYVAMMGVLLALASAGTGDVLAGAIAGLMAQGLAPFEAACCGVYLHAAAAEGLRPELGDAGLLAGDLLPELPRTLRELRAV